MTTDAITLTDRNDLLSIIPVVLGYHPTNSIVIACLTAARHRLEPVIRADFPTGDQLTDQLRDLAEHASQHGHAALVLLYHPDADTIYDEEIRPLFTVPVLDIVRITDPTPHPLHPRGHAEAILAGRRILPDRAAVARTVEYNPTGPTVDLEHTLSPFTTANTRDAYLSAHIDDPAAVADLLAAAQHAPDDDPRTPHLLAALAVLAYRHHDGTLAVAALDRALRDDPHHRMSQLMAEAIRVGLTPDELAAGLRDLP
jgi:hypothetical protein